MQNTHAELIEHSNTFRFTNKGASKRRMRIREKNSIPNLERAEEKLVIKTKMKENPIDKKRISLSLKNLFGR